MDILTTPLSRAHQKAGVTVQSVHSVHQVHESFRGVMPAGSIRFGPRQMTRRERGSGRLVPKDIRWMRVPVEWGR